MPLKSTSRSGLVPTATSKYSRLWGYVRPFWHLEVLSLIVMAIVAGLALALPRAIQYMIDVLIPSLANSPGHEVDVHRIAQFGAVLLALYLGNVVFSWIRDYIAGVVGAGIIRNVRLKLFRHLERLSLKFHQEHQVGEIMSRLLNDVLRMQNLLSETLLALIMNMLLLAAILIYLLNVNGLLTLVAVIPVPLTILASDRYGKKIHTLISQLQGQAAVLSARVQERLLGIKTVKAFGQEDREAARLDVTLKELFHLSVQNSVAMSLAANLVQLINMLGPIVVLAWGVYLVATGAMKLGELIAFYILLTYLYAPVQGLAQTNIQVQSAMASVDRVFEYLEIEPEIVEADEPISLSKVAGEIRFERVSFSYGNQKFQLSDLSFSIQPKEKVAIVGGSGSGKTTIVNLLMRFFDPSSGRILIDGVDLKTLAIDTIRRQIALVDQDPLLFRGTIHDNIAYGNPYVTTEEIISAAQIANIHDFIMSLPDGYDSEIGERGVTVSGGERQRLCLARAVALNPAVLILDEATSALDANSEQLIQESLKRILIDKTALVIAHRLATIQHVDRIIVLENGRIIDEGTHAALAARCPLYQELARKQMIVSRPGTTG